MTGLFGYFLIEPRVGIFPLRYLKSVFRVRFIKCINVNEDFLRVGNTLSNYL